MSNVLSSQLEQNAKPVTLLAPIKLYDSFFLADEQDTVYVSQRELKDPMIVVHINEKRGHAFLMNIRGTLKKPIRVEIVDLIDAVESSELQKGETFQSTQSKTPYDQLNDNQKVKASLRLKIIESLVNDLDSVFYSSYRDGAITKVANENNLTKATIYRYLWAYLYSGMKLAALGFGVGEYANSVQPVRVLTKPQGRPSKRSKVTGIDTRKIIDSTDIENFKFAISLMEKGGKGAPRTFQAAYDRMLPKKYAEKIVLLDNRQAYMSGNEKEIHLKPENERPSFWQFKYWLEQTHGDGLVALRNKIVPHSKRHSDLNGRVGNAYVNVTGPGQRYEIDETPYDEEILSELIPGLSLGKPTLYVIIDVYSRYIVGFYLTFGNPSVYEMSNAIYQCLRDRKAWLESIDCADFLPYWIQMGPPETIAVDNAEFNNTLSESILNSLGVRVDFGKPGSGNDKPFIESVFNKLKGTLPHLSPGHRGESPSQQRSNEARKHALLTKTQLYREIMRVCVHHNTKAINKHFNLEKEAILDGVKRIPADIVTWAKHNMKSRMRPLLDGRELRLALLPQGEVSVQQKGIYLKGQPQKLFYNCPAIRLMGLQDRPHKGASRSKVLSCRYDPNDISRIWIDYKGEQYEALIDQKYHRYEGMNQLERDELDALLTLNEEESHQEEANSQASLYASVEAVINQSKQQIKQLGRISSTAQKVRESRKLENGLTDSPLEIEPNDTSLSDLDSGDNNKNNDSTKKTPWMDRR